MNFLYFYQYYYNKVNIKSDDWNVQICEYTDRVCIKNIRPSA